MTLERLAPDAILASTNLSGSVTDIDDDPDSPDGLWLTAPGSNNNTNVRVSFPTPSGSLDTTTDIQTVRVLVRKTNHSQAPFATLFLYENGSQVKTLQAQTGITSTTGEIMSGTFSASEITNPANVEVYIDGVVGGGSPGNRASLEVGAIEWNAEVVAGGGSTNANAENAALTVSANNTTTEIDASGQNSPVTATANNPGNDIKSSAQDISVTVSANNATVTTGGGGTSANSEEITVTVSALQPSININTKAQIP